MINIIKKKFLFGRRHAIFHEMIIYPVRQLMVSAGKIFGLRLLTKKELLESSGNHRILSLGLEELVTISAPVTLDKDSDHFSHKTGKFHIGKAFCFELENTEIIGKFATGFDSNGKLITETLSSSTNAQKLTKKVRFETLILKSLPRIRTPQLNEVCSLAIPASKNYYHWTMDCLLRIRGYEYYKEETGRNPTLLIDSNLTSWKIESLKLLGYEPGSYEVWNLPRAKVKRLVVPSFPRGDRGIVSPTACHWLRQRILSNLNENTSKKVSFSPRILISRSQKNGRHIINENEVLEALKPLGFVSYKMEDISFSDQVRLFANAEIVIAPHGAGLANIIFSKNLTVIELFGTFVFPCFFVLSKSLGFRYGYLVSNSNNQNQFNSKLYPNKHQGIWVNVADLLTLLSKV